MTDPAPITLQRLVLPDPGIGAEQGLFLRFSGPGDALAGTVDGDRVALPAGAGAVFDSYMNLLDLATWETTCGPLAPVLRLSGAGRAVLRMCGRGADATPRRGTRIDPRSGRAVPRGAEDPPLAGPVQTLFRTRIDLDAGPVVIALPDGVSGRGLLVWPEIVADGGPVRIDGGAWTVTPATAPAPLRLALSITTFRRETEVAATVARVTAFLDGAGAQVLAAAGVGMHLFVVDNGQTLSLPAHPRLTLVANPNLGGAGGFARGLAAAEDGGFSHCLFMDDDASFQMESLLRTSALLALARDPRTAVAGAMISAGAPGRMWENGAVFDRLCRPRFSGTDLGDPEEIAAMLLAAGRRPRPRGFYGGWWFFAFPLAAVRHYPFPFFVRGDDISFSLAHRFATVTLNGIVSFQEDFSAKESALTLYLDLRNHLHHHLVQDGMELGPRETARIVARFLLRSIVRMHYDSAEAQLQAWEDVMAGPGFFADNADMAARRHALTALMRTEAWRPAMPADLAVPEIAMDRAPGRLFSALMKYTLNGHLIPFWSRIGRRRRIPVSHRGLIWALWGLSGATFVNAGDSRVYRVAHDKRRAVALLWRAFGMYRRWSRDYGALRDAHRRGYAELATRAFWQGRFLPAPAASARSAAAAPAAPAGPHATPVLSDGRA
jgi:galactofuranosylgalactofuranosylrhamnosyl-N-acetylglucosaminyl-diphospho-decaprenol beta-1,5/1,6-galactofuranosyltransferase